MKRPMTALQLKYFGKGRKRAKPALFGAKGKIRRHRVARKPRKFGGASGLKRGLTKLATGLERDLGLGGEEA